MRPTRPYRPRAPLDAANEDRALGRAEWLGVALGERHLAWAATGLPRGVTLRLVPSLEALADHDFTAPRPAAVLTPLTGVTLDAVDVAETLAEAGYAGRLVVLIPPVPRLDLILREIAAVHPALAVELEPDDIAPGGTRPGAPLRPVYSETGTSPVRKARILS